MQRVGHEHRRVVGHLHVDVARQGRPDPGHLGVQPARHFDLVAAGYGPDAEVDGLLVAELGDVVGLLGTQLHPGHVRQPYDRPVPLGHDEVLELLGGTQIGVGQEVDLYQLALGLTHGREVVVALQRGVYVAGREVERGQPVGVDPDPHGDGTAAHDVHPLHPRQGGELGLHVAGEPVGELGDIPLGRREAQIERRVGPVRPLHFDDGRLGLGGQLGANLLQPGGHLCQRRRAVVVQLQVHGDAADAGPAGGLDVVDARNGGDGALDRRREKATHGLGAGAVIHRRDQHRRALDARILLHRQRRDCSPSHEHDDEVHDHREDGVLDERIGH